MFELRTKEVEIKEPNGNVVKYKLRPLSGRYLHKVFNIVKAMSKTKPNKELSKEEQAHEAFNSFSDTVVNDLHLVIFETLKASYPKEDVEQLDLFTSQNLLSFLDPIIEINMPDDKQ
jgi:Zn-dependent oligopeptidase